MLQQGRHLYRCTLGLSDSFQFIQIDPAAMEVRFVDVMILILLVLLSSSGDALKMGCKYRFTLVNSSDILSSGREPSASTARPKALREHGFSIYPEFLDYYHSTFAFTPRGYFQALLICLTSNARGWCSAT